MARTQLLGQDILGSYLQWLTMHDIPNELSLLTLYLSGTLVVMRCNCDRTFILHYEDLIFFFPCSARVPSVEPPAASTEIVPGPRVELKLNKIAMMKLQEAARFPLTVVCGGTGQSL